MSKRSIKKVRHYKSAPTFAEAVKAGQNKGAVTITTKTISNNQEHVHDEGCKHD